MASIFSPRLMASTIWTGRPSCGPNSMPAFLMSRSSFPSIRPSHRVRFRRSSMAFACSKPSAIAAITTTTTRKMLASMRVRPATARKLGDLAVSSHTLNIAGGWGDFAHSDLAVSAPLVSLAWVSQHESAAAEALGFWTSRTVTLLRV